MVIVTDIFIGFYTHPTLYLVKFKSYLYDLVIGKQNLNLTSKWDVLEAFFERSKCTKKTNSCLLITFLSTHAHVENFQSVENPISAVFLHFILVLHIISALISYTFFVLTIRTEIKIIYIYFLSHKK